MRAPSTWDDIFYRLEQLHLGVATYSSFSLRGHWVPHMANGEVCSIRHVSAGAVGWVKAGCVTPTFHLKEKMGL